jgi:triosephosphate isomerase (TIM)
VRPVLIAANWKMNTTAADAGELAASIAVATDDSTVQRVICPPYVALRIVGEALAGTGIEVGAQNVHHEVSGAYTGEISAQMLRGLARWAIVGHSERRRDQHETDEVIGRKLVRCREADLRPILCVGEQLEERERGLAVSVVRDQLRKAFDAAARDVPVDDIAARLVIAYEPVWAIGTGRTPRGADAAEMADAIRDALAAIGVPAGAAAIQVLYGGSVTSASIGEFLAEPAIDGALVGGASLKVDEIAGIVARAGITARARLHATAPVGGVGC